MVLNLVLISYRFRIKNKYRTIFFRKSCKKNKKLRVEEIFYTCNVKFLELFSQARHWHSFFCHRFVRSYHRIFQNSNISVKIKCQHFNCFFFYFHLRHLISNFINSIMVLEKFVFTKTIRN